MLANFDLTTAVQFDIKEMYPGTNAHRKRKIVDKGRVVSYKVLFIIVVFTKKKENTVKEKKIQRKEVS